jgi:hypothetical protein
VPHQADHRVLHRIFSFRVIAQRHARDPERPALDAGEESVERALPVHRFLPRFARAAERQWRIERSRAIHRFFPHRHPTPRTATVYNASRPRRLTPFAVNP